MDRCIQMRKEPLCSSPVYKRDKVAVRKTLVWPEGDIVGVGGAVCKVSRKRTGLSVAVVRKWRKKSSLSSHGVRRNRKKSKRSAATPEPAVEAAQLSKPASSERRTRKLRIDGKENCKFGLKLFFKKGNSNCPKVPAGIMQALIAEQKASVVDIKSRNA